MIIMKRKITILSIITIIKVIIKNSNGKNYKFDKNVARKVFLRLMLVLGAIFKKNSFR